MSEKKKNKYVVNGEDTVLDTETGLMWKRTDSMADLKKWVNYQDSADYVRELRENKFGGFDDWRLPSREEMTTLYDESHAIKDYFGKEIHLNEAFAIGGGFSMIAQQVSGRMRTWVLNLRDGEFSQPEGLWTLTEAARAVRTIKKDDQ